MKKETDDTTIERQLMTVINNFIEWDTNKEDYKKAQKYIRYVSEEKFPRYNHWFRVTKDDVIKFIENNLKEE